MKKGLFYTCKKLPNSYPTLPPPPILTIGKNYECISDNFEMIDDNGIIFTIPHKYYNDFFILTEGVHENFEELFLIKTEDCKKKIIHTLNDNSITSEVQLKKIQDIISQLSV